MKIWFCLLCLLIFNPITKIFSQTWDYSYTHYSKEDGLPSNTVYCMKYDNDGLLWVGTDVGLCCFNGSKIKHYRTENGLPSNEVFDIFCDSKNRLWLTTMSKEACYIYHGKVFNKQNDTTLGKVLISNQITQIREDPNGTILIVTYASEINFITKAGQHSYKNLNTLDSLKKYNGITTICKLNGGFLIFGSNRNYYYPFESKAIISFSPNIKTNVTDIIGSGNQYFYTLSNQDKIQTDSFTTDNEIIKTKFVKEKKREDLFLDNDKIWRRLEKGILMSPMNDLNSQTLFLKDYQTSYFTSNSNSKWIGTLGGGLFKINSESISNFKVNSNNVLDMMHSIALSNNCIFVGNNKGVVYILDRSSRKVIKEIKFNQQGENIARTIKLIYEKNSLYIANDIGVFEYNLIQDLLTRVNTTYSTKNIYLKDHDIYIVGGGALQIFNKQLKMSQKLEYPSRLYSYTSYLDQELFGTQESLLIRQDNHFNHYDLGQPFKHYVKDLIVKDSMLVVCTQDSGVFFVIKNKIIRNVNVINGLNSNYCHRILTYKNKYYIATNNGICVYDYVNQSIKSIYESDGLISNNVNDIAIDKDTIYAVTDNGMSVIPLNFINPKDSFGLFVKPCIINQDTIWECPSVLGCYDDYSISLELNTLSVDVKGELEYYYKINSLAKEFTITNDPILNIRIPSPGQYELEIFAKNTNNLSSKLLKIPIHVKAYFYQTTYFKIGCIIAFLLISYLLSKVIAKRAKNQELKRIEISSRMQQLELQAWKANINPHFLFNSLNTMQSLFSSDKFEEANNFMTNFSKMLRKTIDSSDQVYHTLKDEIEYLNLYLKLESSKKGDFLKYKIRIDNIALNSKFIPTLLIQPIVENSLKHGIKQSKNGEINISFHQEENLIQCRIEDNGIGFKQEIDNVNSKGLRMVKEKISFVEKLSGKQISFTYKNKNNQEGLVLGTITEFSFPIDLNE